MARIVHTHRLQSLAAGSGPRRLPPVGSLFLVLAGVVAAVELWPAVNAAWLGVTDVVGEFADVLPAAFRSAAIVVLPAAVLWARPRAPRVNPWLWKGAVIVAVVQLARYPVELAQGALIEAAGASEVGTASPELIVANVISLLLAILTTLGIWALSEGLKDAGARFGIVVIAGLAALVAAVVIVVFGPTVLAAIDQGVDPLLVVNLASVLTNGLFLFALALLAARSLAGALRRLDPPIAWRLGAIAAVSLAVVPVASVGLSVLTSVAQTSPPEIVFTALRLSSFIGWPLFAVAAGMGMGAWRASRGDGFRMHRYSLGSTPRVVMPGPLAD